MKSASISNDDIKQKEIEIETKIVVNTKKKMNGKLAAKFGHLNLDPSKMKVGAAPPQRIRSNQENRGIDHTVLMNKVTVIKKGRKKRTRKRIYFDDDGGIIHKI